MPFSLSRTRQSATRGEATTTASSAADQAPNARVKLLAIDVGNELTGETAFVFADGLSRLDLKEHQGVLLQLEPDSHIDVNGLAALVRVFSHLKAKDKRLYVDHAPEPIARALERLGLARVLHVPPTAKRVHVDPDPNLSALTGSYPVVPSPDSSADHSAELNEDPGETQNQCFTLNNTARGPSTPVTRTLSTATE